MEDKNMARVELNEQDTEQVVGGAFTYYEDGTDYKCDIDGYGTVYAKYSAKRTVTKIYLANKDKSVAEIVQMAMDAGVFSTTPIDPN